MTSPGRDWEYRPFIFETANADDAARNLYLHLTGNDRLSAQEVLTHLKSNGFSFALKDISEHSLSEIFQKNLDLSRSWSKYDADHCIIDVESLKRPGKMMFQSANTCRRGELERLLESLSLSRRLSNDVRRLMDRVSGPDVDGTRT